MAQYDPKFIEQYAENLYKQAKTVTGAHFFIGILLGFLIFGSISNRLTGSLDFLIISIGVLIGGVFGFGSGQNKASSLKLEAQMALCQIKIEENSRS